MLLVSRTQKTQRPNRFTGFSFSLLMSAGLGLGIGFSPLQQARADSLTTLFAANNSHNPQGGIVYFDLNVLASGGLTVNSLDVNTDYDNSTNTAGSNFSLEIYTRTGTYSGFTGSSAGWTLVSTGSGIIGNIDVPVAVDVTDFSLGSGVTGVGVRYVGAQAVYTNGTGNYSNASVALTAGASQTTPFSGNLIGARIFNGTINYTLNAANTAAPEPGSLALLLPVMGTVGVVIRKHRKR
jgi:hypothetical protein